MDSLPDGIVTFLFTDVEGSTRLLERDPDALDTALARHHEILAVAVAAHRGAVFETVGDAVYAAFASPTDGLAAAAAIQRAMAATDWSPLPPLRVRIAVERGPVERRGSHYFGSPLFRCARLQALAWGSQTLCSADVAGAVGDLPPGLRLRPRGPHRLKDLAAAVDVFQVDVDGLAPDARLLRTSAITPTNLPAEVTAFVGRHREIAAVAEALGSSRIVTLLGPGGTGKTRLAVEVARTMLGDFPDGVFLVELASVLEPTAVPAAIAAAAGIAVRPGEAAEAALGRALAGRRILLVIDNWEHVVSAAGAIPRIASAAPGLHILATSRVPLRVRGERRMPVPQLDPAGDGPALIRLRAEAVGARVGPADQVVVAEICRRLDGLPLAIELVAARAATLPLRSILADVQRGRLGAAGGADLPDRQRTVERSVAWSMNLLSAEVRLLFVRLGIFAGSFTTSDAGAVAGIGAHGDHVGEDDLGADDRPTADMDVLDGLAALAEASLLVPREDPFGEPRFSMLETVRSFAAAALVRSLEAEALRRSHAGWVRNTVVSVDRLLEDAEAGAWMARFDALREDVAAALEFAIGRADGQLACGIVGDLWPYWDARGVRPDEHARALRSVAVPGVAPAALARALNTVGVLEGNVTRGRGTRWFERAIDLYRSADRPLELAESLNNLAISLEPGDDRLVALFEEALTLKRAHGARPYELANSLTNLAIVRAAFGDVEGARRDADVALDSARRSGGKLAMVASTASAYVAAVAGDVARLEREATESLVATLAVTGHGPLAADPAELRALGFALAGEADAAGRLLGYADALRSEFSYALDGWQRPIRDRIVTLATAASTPEAWKAALADGRRLSDAEALALARTA